MLNWIQNHMSLEGTSAYDCISFICHGNGGFVARFVVGKLFSCKSIPKALFPYNFVCINTPLTNLQKFNLDPKLIHDLSAYHCLVAMSLFKNKCLYSVLDTESDQMFCDSLAISASDLTLDFGTLTEIQPKNDFKIHHDRNAAQIDWNRFAISLNNKQRIPHQLSSHIHLYFI